MIEIIQPVLVNNQGSGSPGREWMRSNAIYYDFSRIQALTGTAIQASDTGIDDVGIGAVDGSPLNGILASTLVFNNRPVGCIVDTADDAVSIGQSSALKSFFRRTSFEVHILFHSTDGQDSVSYNLMGVLSTGAGYFNIFIETNGRLNVGYATNVASNIVNWASTATGVIPNGETPVTYLRFRLDFVADTITVWKDGTSVPGSITSGTIGSINTALWDTAQNVYIGSLNNAGTPGTNNNSNRIIRVALTPADPPVYVMTYFANPVYDTIWQSIYSGITASNAASVRTALRTAIFGTYPANAVPAAIQSVTSGNIHGIPIVNLTGAASITRYIYNRGSGNANRIYEITNVSPNGRSFWYSLGHSPINDTLALNNFLSLGYNVQFCAMAESGDTEDLSDNTQSGADWTPVNGGNHNEMSSLGVPGMSYHFYDKIEHMNYLQANASYSAHYFSGISGGGWLTTFIAALDERWTKCFPIRGVKPRIFKSYPSIYLTLSDYEQGGSNGSIVGSGQAVYDFFTSNPYEYLIALGATNGRLLKIVTHFQDTALLGDNTFNTWKTTMEGKAAELGGIYKIFLNTNPAEAVHLVYQDELNEIISELPPIA